jgi:diguanylate cyclase (GGDEF)-like protein/PAS domain S-box-containing protein
LDDLRKAFFTSSTVPFAIAGRDGVLVDVNPAFARVVGQPASALRGTGVADLMHPDDREATAHQFATLGGEPAVRVWVNRLRSTEHGWRSLRWTTWLDAEHDVVCGVAQDVTGESDAAAQLSRLAYDDQLTGLANRARLLEAIDLALAAEQPAGTLGVLFLDVDGFKAVNDGHGHAAGDMLLRELGRRLRGAVRRTDVLARLGGDEFVVALPGLPDEVDEVRVAVRGASAHLLDALATPFEVAGEPVRLGGSVGAAAWPWSGGTADELLAAADAAMYTAKRRDGAAAGCALHPTIA